MNTQAAFIAELSKAVEARGLVLRNDPVYSNTGTLYVADATRPLDTPLAVVQYAFNAGYASFNGPFKRAWGMAKFADGDLRLVLDEIDQVLVAALAAPK